MIRFVDFLADIYDRLIKIKPEDLPFDEHYTAKNYQTLCEELKNIISASIREHTKGKEMEEISHIKFMAKKIVDGKWLKVVSMSSGNDGKKSGWFITGEHWRHTMPPDYLNPEIHPFVCVQKEYGPSEIELFQCRDETALQELLSREAE